MNIANEKTVKCFSLKASAYAIKIEDFKNKILIFPSAKEFFTNIYNISFPTDDQAINNDSQNKLTLDKNKNKIKNINIDIQQPNTSNQENKIEDKESDFKKMMYLRRNLKTDSFKKLILGPCNKKWYKPLQLICNSRFLKEDLKKGSGFNKDAFKKRSRDCWSHNFLTKFITLSGTSNAVVNEFAKNFKIRSNNQSDYPSNSDITQENQNSQSLKGMRNKGKFLIWNFTHTNLLL